MFQKAVDFQVLTNADKTVKTVGEKNPASEVHSRETVIKLL